MLHGNKKLKTWEREEQILKQNFLSPQAPRNIASRPPRPGLGHTRSLSLPKIHFDRSTTDPSSESEHQTMTRRTTTASAHMRVTPHAIDDEAEEDDHGNSRLPRSVSTPFPHFPDDRGQSGPARSNDEREGLTDNILPPIGDLEELLGEEGRKQIAQIMAAELRKEDLATGKNATTATNDATVGSDAQLEREQQEQEQRLMDLKVRFHLASPAPLARNSTNTTPEEELDGATDLGTGPNATRLATHFPLPSSSLFSGGGSSSEETVPELSPPSSTSASGEDVALLRRASLALPSPSLTATPESTPPTSLPTSLGPSPLTSPSTMRLSSSFSSLPVSLLRPPATKPHKEV
jgi:hypothetical protein